MLVRTVTWTTSRDAQWGNYAQTMFYDGQGFMVNRSLGVDSALELQGASVCVTQGTTTPSSTWPTSPTRTVSTSKR